MVYDEEPSSKSSTMGFETTQAILDAVGIFLYKTPNEAHRLLEDRVLLKLNWSKDIKAKPLPKTVAFAEGSDNSKLMENMEALTTKIDSQFKEIKREMKKMRDGCNSCGCPHPSSECDDKPMGGPKDEEANYAYGEFMVAQNSSNDFVKTQFFNLKTKVEQGKKNHQAVIQDLETNGKTYDPPVNLNAKTTIIHDDSEDEADESEKEVESSSFKQTKSDPPPLKAYKPKISYPQCLRKEKMEERYAKFIDLIKEVRINVPLVDVLAGLPNYGKFLKDLVGNKSKMEQISTTFLNEECSAIFQNKLPPKLGNPGSFVILCTLANSIECLTLVDLGARINLMPYSL
ncbi:hypothetical protein Tco_0903747 [Tanacetum coccineum]